METIKFKKSLNSAELYFEVFYVVYFGILMYKMQFKDAFSVLCVGVVIFGYLLLIRPFEYSITRKTLVIHKRLGKDKEINLMDCQTITDPITKMTKIITNPHSLEIYTENKERVVVTPKQKIEFIDSVVNANKRIHVQVKDFASNRKSGMKKNRK